MKNKDSKRSLARQIYDNSPIIEALVEVYFSQTKNDFSVWADFSSRVKNSYPDVEELLVTKAELQVSPTGEGKQKISPEKLYRFYNKDKTQLIQANKDFVTFNQLKPYLGYEKFKTEVKEVLRNYIDATSPKSINRIGMRYINQIPIQGINVELGSYLRFTPQIPDEVTDSVNDVLIQIQFIPRNSNHQVTTSLRSGISSIEGQVVFLLDIYDILQINNEIDMELILSSIDEAHENTERVFEGFITDEARKLFGVVKNNGRKRGTKIQK
jgi:uncharacterized protein (TIGR04255 family)